MSRAAAEALTAARRAAGVSQEVLAERAGVSSRTVRALESGQAKRPHRDTLLAVGRALGLDSASLRSFVALWRSDRLEAEQVFVGDEAVIALQRDLELERRRLRDRSITTVLAVGADRRWQQTIMRRRFEVVQDEIRTLTWMLGCDPAVNDLAAVRVVSSSNIEIESTPLVEAGVVAFTGRLGRTLRAGDVYECEFTTDFTDSYRPGVPHNREDDEHFVIVQEGLPMATLETKFDHSALPARVWLSRRDHVAAASVVVSEVAINDFGIAQVHLEHLAPGVHGMEWEWPS